MARKHRFSIVVMLGAAVVAGFLALSRSVQLGAASKPASAAQVSARAHSLDRLEAQLRRELAALPAAAPRAQKVGTRSTSPGVVYVRSPASPTSASHGDEATTASTAPRGTTGGSERRAEMTNHVVRLYTAAASIIVFFVAWAGIAARPWVTPAPDPQAAALAQRQHRLQRDARLVQLVAARREAANRAAQVAARAAARAAPAPSVRIVHLPPLTTTRSS